jgi:hypothetical protein
MKAAVRTRYGPPDVVRGVHVTAVCDTAHLELVRGLGAERVIDRTVDDFTQDDQTYDVVIDAVGRVRSAGAGGYSSRAEYTCPPSSARTARTRSWRSSPRCCPAGRFSSRYRDTTRQ